VVPPSCPLPLSRRASQSVSAVLPSGPFRQDRTTEVKSPLIRSRAYGCSTRARGPAQMPGQPGAAPAPTLSASRGTLARNTTASEIFGVLILR
jgi:hypothetical protein